MLFLRCPILDRVTSLSFASYTLATWLSLMNPVPELPRIAIAQPEMRMRPQPVQLVLDEAIGLLGTPYRRGGTNPENGIDCSFLTRRAYSRVGIHLPQSAAMQIKVGDVIEKNEIEPGDLVFFKNTYKKGISHVGIALGDDLFVHAASSKHGVIVSSLDNKYFSLRFAGARRIKGLMPSEIEQEIEAALEDEAFLNFRLPAVPLPLLPAPLIRLPLLPPPTVAKAETQLPSLSLPAEGLTKIASRGSFFRAPR